MGTKRASAHKLWLGVVAGAGLLQLATTAAAAGPACVADAKVNLASVSMSDFVAAPGGGWTPGVVNLNGTASEPKANKGGVYAWSFVGTPLGTLSGANTPQVTLTAPDVPATRQATLRLTVSSSDCGSDFVDIPITIANAHDVVQNAAPRAVPVASPASPTEGTLVTLDGSASSDPENAPLTYTWTQVGGPAVVLQTVAGSPAVRTFVAPNLAQNTLLTFQLTVSDGSLTGSDTTFVNVSWTNDAPVAALACPGGVIETAEGAPVTLDGSGSMDGDGGIVGYAWQQMVGEPAIAGLDTATTSSVMFNAPSLGYMQDGMVPVKLTVTDAAGAKSSAQCMVVIRDVTRPTITLPSPSPLVAEATSATGATVTYTASAHDAVDGDLPAPNFLCEPPPGSLFALDAISPVVCSAQDSAGNEATAGFSVRVVDRTAPVIGAPASMGVEATGPGGAAATYAVKSTDAVDGEKDAVCTPASGSTFPIASPGPTSTVNCAATDARGNVATPVAFQVTVYDTTPPVIDSGSVSADIVKEATSPAGAVATFALPSATDLVDLRDVAVACVPASGSTFALGESTVRCDAVDRRGNSTAGRTPATTATFKVTVADTTPPALSGMPPDATIEATSAAGAAFTYVPPTASDLVDGAVTVSCSPLSGTFALGTTPVACTAADTRGNTASGGFNVTVRDTTPPTLALPSLSPVEATGPSGAAVAFVVSASDTVDPSVTPSCSAASGDVFALGTTLVNCTATDDAGNVAAGSFTVTVRDTTGPAIAAHDDVSATATSHSSAIVQYTLPTATDLVDGAVPVTCMPAPGSSFAVGPTTVNCSATDSRGNVGRSTFNVIVSYAFAGFFQPVDNTAVNSVKAGSAVPVKFSLGGNQGLAIFPSGSPMSVGGTCGSTIDEIEETVTAGGSSLQYDATTGQYTYVWKTEKSWVGTCRVLRLAFRDGTTRTASFRFK